MLRVIFLIIFVAAIPGLPLSARFQETSDIEITKSPSLSQLSWLAESWKGEDGESKTEEVWMTPRGGMMLGMNRTSMSGKASFENLRIVEVDGKITYLASPGGAKPTPFALKEMDQTKVVFENTNHDFPQRIIYHRSGDDLVVRIEGEVDGKLEAMEMTWCKSGTASKENAAIFQGIKSAIYRVEDLDKAKAWYSNILGVAPYFDEPYYVGFKVGDQELGLDPDVKALVRGNNQPAYWSVANCQEAYDELLKKGAKSDAAPQDVGGGTIVATVSDPFGNIIGIIETPASK